MKTESNCPCCKGSGGEYWMAPVYHNERVREWSRCGGCGGSGTADGYNRVQGKRIVEYCMNGEAQ